MKNFEDLYTWLYKESGLRFCIYIRQDEDGYQISRDKDYWVQIEKTFARQLIKKELAIVV